MFIDAALLLLLVFRAVIPDFVFRFARLVADLAASSGETKSLVLVILPWALSPLFTNSCSHPSLAPGFGGSVPGRVKQKANWPPCLAL